MSGCKAILELLLLSVIVSTSGRAAAADAPSMVQASTGITTAAAGQVEPALTGDSSDVLALPADRLRWHVPDPGAARAEAERRREEARQEGKQPTANYCSRMIERIDETRRPQQVELTLEEVLQRTLANSYAIELRRYNPAIETTRVVEAEAAFDAVFFTNVTKNKVDRPTGSQLSASKQDLFDSSFGIRKLLPTGMQVSGSYGFRRTKTNIQFQEVNPEYFSTLVFEMRQPFLRGFGIDYNRSIIRLRQNDRRINRSVFRRQVRDTLRQVEEAYWRLLQARRDIVITARLLADFEAIYEYLVARQAFDATPVQLSASRADLEASHVDFIQRRANLFDAEDRLIALMNDPEINLADRIEIIPTDLPQLGRIEVDRLGEVQRALDHRPEIKEQELQVANAKIFLERAKIEELPRLDFSFRYTIDGLGTNADESFDEVTGHNYVEYFVGVELEVPIGNRGPRAARHRARLQHAQAAAQLKLAIEQAILDVNVATRSLSTAYDQITPSFHSAESREREVDSIVARAERKDFNTLTTELNARRALASARRAMLGAMVDYNVAIIELEKVKGTLLSYNNVVIAEEEE